MAGRNYQKELDQRLAQFQAEGRTPDLLLHSCCAPCSSYVLEYLSQYFRITVFYYNPNITDSAEYHKRVDEVRRLISGLPAVNPISFIEGEYEPRVFTEAVKGLEKEPEGGARCNQCFRLRLGRTAALAARLAAERGRGILFTTTLTISPLKNAAVLNSIGEEMASLYEGIVWLDSDFKKREGYKRSIELSAKYNLYRQDYCGCIYSKLARDSRVSLRCTPDCGNSL